MAFSSRRSGVTARSGSPAVRMWKTTSWPYRFSAVWGVEKWQRALGGRHIFRISGHAGDGVPLAHRSYAAAYRLTAWEISLRECLVHDEDRICALGIVLVECAAVEYRNPQEIEVAGRHQIACDVHALARTRHVTFNLDPVRRAGVEPQRYRFRPGHRRNARSGGETAAYPLAEALPIGCTINPLRTIPRAPPARCGDRNRDRCGEPYRNSW